MNLVNKYRNTNLTRTQWDVKL